MDACQYNSMDTFIKKMTELYKKEVYFVDSCEKQSYKHNNVDDLYLRVFFEKNSDYKPTSSSISNINLDNGKSVSQSTTIQNINCI